MDFRKIGYLEEIISVSVRVVICGDFNIDALTTHLVSNKCKKAIIADGFENQPENPTLVTENSKTCIDHFIYQDVLNPSFEVLGNEAITDHYPILMRWDVEPDCSRSCQVYRDTSFL